MKKLIQKFERFCIQHRNLGIPNLMLYIAVGSAIIYAFGFIDPSAALYNLLCFDRARILQGQVWRLLTFLITPAPSLSVWSSLITFLVLFFYYRIGMMLERSMGTLKFNLFYFTGVLLVDTAGMLFGWYVTADSLHLSLILAFATLYSEAQVLLMYIIPIKMKYLAWIYLAFLVRDCVFYRSLVPLLPLGSYLLFFSSEFYSLLPAGWRANRFRSRQARTTRKSSAGARPSPHWADSYQSKTGQKPYHHKCTVCGRTDTEHPQLEFRYCSRCSGYYCYCMDHINNHAHIQ